MHETIIAGQIINEAKKHGNVKEITVEVGDLAHLPAQEIKETLEKMTDWKVNIVKMKGKVKCKCSYTGIPKILQKTHGATFFVCPKCNSIPDILDGDKIILKGVKVR